MGAIGTPPDAQLTGPGAGASFQQPPAAAEAMSIMHPPRSLKAAAGPLLAVFLALTVLNRRQSQQDATPTAVAGAAD